MMPFTAHLYKWYELHARNLPWRDTCNPYHVWLSEVILQQTQVAQGTAYYHRFISRFPTVAALAAASEDEVLKLWQGLGYYSRARNLHKAAQQVMAQGGRIPSDYAALRRLQGVGDYTAAAICAFAFGLPYAAIDGNFYRVTARYFGIHTPIDTTEGRKQFKALGEMLIDRKAPARFNQAMMDFGATWCTPRQPRCTECPLAAECCARAENQVLQLPVKAKRTAVTTRYFHYIIPVFESEGRAHTVLYGRPAGDIWTGLFTPPLYETAEPATADEVAEAIGCDATALVAIACNLHHQLTHRTIIASAYRVHLADRTAAQALFQRISPQHSPNFVPFDSIENFAVPRLVEKIFERL